MNRRNGVLVLIALAVVVGAYLTAARRTTGPPFDPRSTAADGTRGLVEVLARLGGEVAVLDGVPDASVDTAVLFVDRYDRDDADALDAWVRAGGTLVVADPGSALTPPSRGAVTDVVSLRCDAVLSPVLGGVMRLDVGTATAFTVEPDAATCTAGDRTVVSVRSVESGTIVAVSVREAFTNRLLDDEDNAVLAASLLVPAPGTAVAVLTPRSVAGAGDRGLVDLVGTPVRAGLAQLAVAFALVVAWRARRLGQPVVEPQAVTIDGSELTAAVGRLLAGNGHPERAAALLRERMRRELGPRVGLAPDAPADVAVDAFAAATSVGPEATHRALFAPVADDDALVAVATTLTSIRQEIIHGRSADIG